MFFEYMGVQSKCESGDTPTYSKKYCILYRKVHGIGSTPNRFQEGSQSSRSITFFYRIHQEQNITQTLVNLGHLLGGPYLDVRSPKNDMFHMP